MTFNSGIRNEAWSRIQGQIEALQVEMKKHNAHIMVTTAIKSMEDTYIFPPRWSFTTEFPNEENKGIDLKIDEQQFLEKDCGRGLESIRLDLNKINWPHEFRTWISIQSAREFIFSNIIAYMEATCESDSQFSKVLFHLPETGRITIGMGSFDNLWSVPDIPESSKQNLDDPGSECGI